MGFVTFQTPIKHHDVAVQVSLKAHGHSEVAGPWRRHRSLPAAQETRQGPTTGLGQRGRERRGKNEET